MEIWSDFAFLCDPVSEIRGAISSFLKYHNAAAISIPRKTATPHTIPMITPVESPPEELSLGNWADVGALVAVCRTEVGDGMAAVVAGMASVKKSYFDKTLHQRSLEYCFYSGWDIYIHHMGNRYLHP